MKFGVSTHVCHGERLQKSHLQDVARHGFTAIELFATKSHFDYHDINAISSLAEWLREAGLTLASVHAPVVDSLIDNKWGHAYSTAARDPEARQATVRELDAALEIAQQIRSEERRVGKEGKCRWWRWYSQ